VSSLNFCHNFNIAINTWTEINKLLSIAYKMKITFSLTFILFSQWLIATRFLGMIAISPRKQNLQDGYKVKKQDKGGKAKHNKD